MTTYSVERGMLDSQPLVILRDDTGRRVRIACHGATVVSFEVPRADALFDVASGYRDVSEIKQHPGSRFATMAPFAGDIAVARYRFDEHEYDLQPGVQMADRFAQHGFVRDVEFTLADLVAGQTSASATLTTTAIRPLPGYPFAIDLAVVFRLCEGGLDVDAHMRNVGDSTAPCFFGWHPYLRVGRGRIDDWVLQIPARTVVRTDAHSIPLPGQAAYASLDSAPYFDFRRPRLIGPCVLDSGYVDLAADPDQRIRTRLADRSDGFEVRVWQESGSLTIFTADTLKRGVRGAIAVEPLECMAGAFNRPECASAIGLQPGAERVFRCGIEVSQTR